MKYYDAAVIIAVNMFGEEKVQIIPPNICVLDHGMFNPALDPNDFQGVLRWLLFAGYGLAIDNGFVIITTKVGGVGNQIPYTVATLPYNTNDSFKENIIHALGVALDRSGVSFNKNSL